MEGPNFFSSNDNVDIYDDDDENSQSGYKANKNEEDKEKAVEE